MRGSETQIEKSQTKNNDAEGVKGGQRLLFTSKNFNLILNVLIGIKKTLVDLESTFTPTAKLEDWHFERRFLTENAWFSSNHSEEGVKT